NRVEQLVHCGLGHEIRPSLTAGMEVSTLAQSDHLLDLWAQRFGLGHSRFNPLFQNERRGHVPQQRTAVAGGTSEFEACYLVTHKNLSFEFLVSGFEFLVVMFPASTRNWKHETRNLFIDRCLHMPRPAAPGSKSGRARRCRARQSSYPGSGPWT